jgi:hypothetical protein
MAETEPEEVQVSEVEETKPVAPAGPTSLSSIKKGKIPMDTEIHIHRRIKTVWSASAFFASLLFLVCLIPVIIMPGDICFSMGTFIFIGEVIFLIIARAYIEAYYIGLRLSP